MKIGEKLKLIRNTEGCTQKEFAKLIGVTERSLKKIETGDQIPRYERIERVCETYPQYTTWLLTSRINLPKQRKPKQKEIPKGSIESHKLFAKEARPLNWYEIAKLIKENAEVLYNNTSQGVVSYGSHKKGYITRNISNRSVFLLSAFALENLLKSYLVYENPCYIKDGKLSSQLRSHKLTKLYKSCKKIPPMHSFEYVFSSLEEGVESWSRYPCAISMDKQLTESEMTEELWRHYNDLFEILSDHLEKLLSQMWTDPYGEQGYCGFEILDGNESSISYTKD